MTKRKNTKNIIEDETENLATVPPKNVLRQPGPTCHRVCFSQEPECAEPSVRPMRSGLNLAEERRRPRQTGS